MNQMPLLIEKSIALLENMYDEKTQLFSYSTSVKNGHYINDFSHSGKYRYSINCYAAIQKLETLYKTPWDLERLISNYFTQHFDNDPDIANRGLLLYILSLMDHDKGKDVYKWFEMRLADRQCALRCNIQELAWASIGITAYAGKHRTKESMDFARRIIGHLTGDCMNPVTLLPRHDRSIRAAFISFGGVAYFLMALEYFARIFNDPEIEALFKRAVSRVMRLQGENGEWPWFIDSSSGAVMDWYPVFSTHQDSMAFLFLLPALDLGVEYAGKAITNSYKWLLGSNEIQEPLIQKRPFFIYRCMKRKRFDMRSARLMRAVMNKTLHKSARIADGRSLEFCTECRSYHIAWIIYVWAERTDFRDFTELEL